MSQIAGSAAPRVGIGGVILEPIKPTRSPMFVSLVTRSRRLLARGVSVACMAAAILPLIVVSNATDASVRRSAVKSGFVTLGSCSGRAVRLRATIPQSAFPPGQTVYVTATVRNVSTRTCVFGGTGTRSLFLGPCGSLPMAVYNRAGTEVWPGRIAPSCPEIGPTTLQPGSPAIATGQWPQTMGFANPRPAPPGKYRLVIGGSLPLSRGLRFTIQVL
jgi:hypothetical protein